MVDFDQGFITSFAVTRCHGDSMLKIISAASRWWGCSMRWVAFFCFFCFSTAALALDDCNAKFPNTGQLDDRLKCLQSNNNSLQSQLDALKSEIGGASSAHAIAKPMRNPSAKMAAKPSKAHVTPPQPLTRAACKKAGREWNSNANVCG